MRLNVEFNGFNLFTFTLTYTNTSQQEQRFTFDPSFIFYQDQPAGRGTKDLILEPNDTWRYQFGGLTPDQDTEVVILVQRFGPPAQPSVVDARWGFTWSQKRILPHG